MHTQESLAELAGVDARTIREIETGRTRRPRASTMRLLLDALPDDSSESPGPPNWRAVSPGIEEVDREAMADPAENSSLQMITDKYGGLLETKLYVPRLPLGLVPRPRLVGQLDGALERPLTLVCAPAGFGKTALLADWSRRRQGPVGWLSLDSGDNDPTRFWRHVAAALDRVRPGVSGWIAPLLGSSAPIPLEGAVTELINELAAEPGEMVLVLDDYHVIDAPAVQASVEFLLEHRPSGLRVVMASRTDPPLPLARWRAGGQLAELRVAGLRFTTEEAASLLRAVVGPDVGARLDDDATAALTDRTEGWAAGLQLAALSLLREPDIAGFVVTFSGSHRYVLDYLTNEVLDQQPKPIRDFLLETSVLDRLAGPLCDAVTGRDDSQAMLETIEAANLFLRPLDDVRGWWQYHQLFADLLRARLRQQWPERVPKLHHDAAEWHAQHGSVDDAVHHALAAGDPTIAARMIEQAFDAAFYARGEGVTIQRWISALPADLIRNRPRLLLAQAHLAAAADRVDEVARLADAAEQVFAASTDEQFEPSVGRANSLVANIPALIMLQRSYVAQIRGDATDSAAFASQALAELCDDERLMTYVTRAAVAVTDWLRGRLTEAERTLARSIAAWADNPQVTVRGRYILGLVQRAQGRLDAAVETCRQALEITAPPRQAPAPIAGAAHVGLGEVAYQRDDLDTALRHLTEGIALSRRSAYPHPLATGLATLAWIRQATGDPAGALAAIGEALQVVPSTAVTGLFNPVPAQRARLKLAQGDLAAAARWADEHGLNANDRPEYAREPEYLVLARVLLAQARPGHALELLDRLRAAAIAQRRTGSIIEIQALRALTFADGGSEADALATLTDALALAHPQGFLRVFADEGAPMATLLGRLIANQRSLPSGDNGVPVDYLGRLMRAFQHDTARANPDGKTPIPGLITRLSEREHEVLRLLAAGKQNQEIADQLCVAVNTVKKHVTHILEKLGAANRTEATARARQLGLLP